MYSYYEPLNLNYITINMIFVYGSVFLISLLIILYEKYPLFLYPIYLASSSDVGDKGSGLIIG